jgi:hypothetical protein
LRQHLKITILVGVLALVAAPTAALATRPAEPGNGPNYSPGSPPTTKAYGYYCQGESKKHVVGTPGTPFSTCVKAHETAAAHPNMSPGRACKGVPGKHIVKGEKGTPHSRCVAEVIKQREEERAAAA